MKHAHTFNEINIVVAQIIIHFENLEKRWFYYKTVSKVNKFRITNMFTNAIG